MPAVVVALKPMTALSREGTTPTAADPARGAVAGDPGSAFLIITALSMKTSLLALARISMVPVMRFITETIFIGLLVVSLIYGLRSLSL